MTVELLHGDAYELLPMCVDSSIDLVLTDPPYNISGKDGAKEIARKDARNLRLDYGEWDKGFDPIPFLEESTRLLRPGGSLIAFTSEFLIDKYVTFRGLQYKRMLVWHKTNPCPQFRPGYQQATEIAVWMVKPGEKPTWNGGGCTHNHFEGSNLTGTQTERTEHPNQKPMWLISEIMVLHSKQGDMVLDPFAGSGTTGVVAEQLGRNAMLMELGDKWHAIAKHRIGLEQAQTKLPLMLDV